MTTTAQAAAPSLAAAAEEPQVYDQRVPTWPIRVASLIIGFLWFTQLQWKLPWDHFGSPGLQPNPTPSAEQPGPFIDKGAGLYHWITVEVQNGNKIVPFYGDLLKNLALPNWELVGWMTFFLESTIMLLLLLGLLTRLGGFLGLMQGVNLFLGLSQAPNEWYWTYGMLMTLQLIFMFTGAGRVWGLDARLRPWLRARIAAGEGWAGRLYRLT
ncbi:MAG: hypothetical protein M3Z04_07880 [Chloroflexota bacterium]|nr:hypothetical protein [Chloroflexota bacterium]